MIRVCLAFSLLLLAKQHQAQDFDSLVTQLYFGVDISNPSTAVIKEFKKVKYLTYSDTVIMQWNLNASIFEEGRNKEKNKTASHQFRFTQSPVPGTLIQSGKITVTTRGKGKNQQFTGINWVTHFTTKEARENFYNKLKEMFQPVATIQIFDSEGALVCSSRFSRTDETTTGIQQLEVLLSDHYPTGEYSILLYTTTGPVK